MENKLKQLEAQAAAANGGEKFNVASAQEVGRVSAVQYSTVHVLGRNTHH
jgi:hypothetical protein